MTASTSTTALQLLPPPVLARLTSTPAARPTSARVLSRWHACHVSTAASMWGTVSLAGAERECAAAGVGAGMAARASQTLRSIVKFSITASAVAASLRAEVLVQARGCQCSTAHAAHTPELRRWRLLYVRERREPLQCRRGVCQHSWQRAQQAARDCSGPHSRCLVRADAHVRRHAHRCQCHRHRTPRQLLHAQTSADCGALGATEARSDAHQR